MVKESGLTSISQWVQDNCRSVLWLFPKSRIYSRTILFFFFFNKFIYLFIYFWLCWVFVSVRGLSPVAVSGGHSSSRCVGLSLSRPLLLRSTGSRRAGSVVVAHGLSCSVACGIFPDQGSNPCPLHWQADSQPLRHQGSPGLFFMVVYFFFRRVFFFVFVFCFWLRWVFVAARGLSLVAASRGYSSLWCTGFLIAVASLVVEHRL